MSILSGLKEAEPNFFHHCIYMLVQINVCLSSFWIYCELLWKKTINIVRGWRRQEKSV